MGVTGNGLSFYHGHMSNVSGFFSVVRQVTVYRNGSVVIETVQNDEAEESERFSVSECQLFSEEDT